MKSLFLVLAMGIIFIQTGLADASIPTSDLEGAKDSPYLGRYDGSKIVAYQQKSFDSFILPLAPLMKISGKFDSSNNIYFFPQKYKKLEGSHTRLVYLLPEGRTSLEVSKNYEKEITAKGGKTLFRCDGAACGGDPSRASSGGGGEMSLGMFMEPENDVKSYNEAFSNGYCALTNRITQQHYFSAELPQKDVFISVLTYRSTGGSFCKAFNNRTIAVVDVFQIKKLEQKMVVIKADKMKKDIDHNGKIALYGIFFDTDKAIIKDSSKPTMDEIAKMLKQEPKRKILVVGHTDNAASFAYNQKLSEKRAQAVVQMLIQKYGISANRLHAVGASYSCPSASNATEEGKAKNRRVVLVGEKN